MSEAPYGEEAARLMADLAAAGYPVDTPARLTGKYVEAVPVLVDWLDRAQAVNIRQAVVRALSVPFARKLARDPLLAEFERVTDDDDPDGLGLRWIVGSALEVLYTDSAYDAYVRLIEQPRFGPARQMLVHALRRSKRPEAVPLLLSLLNDPDVNGQATLALARIADPAAADGLRSMLDDRTPWVRNEAQKGLAKIAKAG